MKIKHKGKEFDIKFLGHASIFISYKDLKIIIDPFRLKTDYHNADYILVTHEHYDHFSKEDIEKVSSDFTKYIFPKSMTEKTKEYEESAIYLEVDEEKVIKTPQYTLRIKATPAHNKEKPFHPKSKKWIGYLLEIDGVSFFHTGDTDAIDSIRTISTDFLFLPVSGTYVMNPEEALQLCRDIKPDYAIPIHYGEIIGNIEDAKILEQSYQNTLILKKELF